MSEVRFVCVAVLVKPDGSADCRDRDEAGVLLDDKPGYTTECSTGTFYVNRQGTTATDKREYGEALFELLKYVDQNYRTMTPATFEQAPE